MFVPVWCIPPPINLRANKSDYSRRFQVRRPQTLKAPHPLWRAARPAVSCRHGSPCKATAARQTRTTHDHPGAAPHGLRPWPVVLSDPGTADTAAPHPVVAGVDRLCRARPCWHTICGSVGWFAAWPPMACPSPAFPIEHAHHNSPSRLQPVGNSPDARRVSWASRAPLPMSGDTTQKRPPVSRGRSS